MAEVVLFSDVRGAGGSADIGYVPLSLLTIASFLQANGISARVVDAQFDDDWREQLRVALPGALYLGISALTGPSLATALEAAMFARREFPKLPIVWGGYHATQAYSDLLIEDLADFVVVGPGEHAALALAEGLRTPPDQRPVGWPQELPNIAVLAEGGVAITRSRFIVDPAKLPAVDYSFVEVEKYLAVNGGELPYVSSYGCPHACAFCAEPAQSLRRWRARTPRQVADDMRALHERYAPRQINICDPNFSSSARRVTQLVDLLIAENLTFDKLCDMRATDVLRLADMMEVKRLRQAGFVTIYLGGESGSNAVLTSLSKDMSAEELLEACRLLDAVGISTIVSFMHDLPEETDADSAMTFDLIRLLADLPNNVQRHHFFTPFPATAMFDTTAVQRVLGDLRVAQADWARSSTYAAGVWAGRRDFRDKCMDQLERIRGDLADPTRLTLPTLD